MAADYDSGRVLRGLADSASTEWMSGIEIYRAYSGNDEARGYSGRYASRLTELVTSGFLEMKREAPRPSCKKTKYYRRVKTVFYSKTENARFKYMEYKDLDPESRYVVRDFYPDIHPWLDKEDYLYPVQKPRAGNLYKPVIVKAERILRITEAEAETKRMAWRHSLMKGLDDV